MYSDEVHFIAPMFMIHPSQFRSLTLKLSLEQFVSTTRDTTMLLLSMVNRSNNKKVLIKIAYDLMLTRRLSLIGISKFFNKLN